MLRGNSRGNVLGSGSDQWAAIDEYRAGTIDEGGLRDVEEGIARSAGALPALRICPKTSRPCPPSLTRLGLVPRAGHCMTAGTASTMTACTETMGLALPGASSIPVSPGSSGRETLEAVNAKRLLGRRRMRTTSAWQRTPAAASWRWSVRSSSPPRSSRPTPCATQSPGKQTHPATPAEKSDFEKSFRSGQG